VVQWQHPVADYALDETAVNPTNDTFYPIQWAHQAVESPAAWAAGCTGDGVRVAVLDGGIFAAHPDLDANVDVACSNSFVTGQPFNNDLGTFWHGTHVAGIVAAEDNNVGVVGIAPDATIMGVKVLHGGSGSFASVIAGILYAADPASFGKPGCARADIINMSLGAEFPKNGEGQLVAALNKAVNFASSNGVLVVSSAGNSGIDFGQETNWHVSPGTSGSGIAVSATGPEGWAQGATNFSRPASYSNYGEGFVSIAGPGGDATLPGNAICTVPTATGTTTNFCWVFDLYLSTSRGTTANGGYSWAAGTSMAAPAVSAVAAIIKQRNPGLSLGALKTELFRATTDAGPNGHDEFYGHGFVNARLACTQ
jgi:lantibiotic leader peptide-processing serine protease